MLFIYPSVAFSFLIIFAGFPIAIEFEGMSAFTNELGAIKTSFPIFIFPTITEPVTIQTLSPNIETPLCFPLLACLIVVKWAMLQF